MPQIRTVTPIDAIRFWLVFCLIGYTYTVSVAADTGLVRYYASADPIFGKYIGALLPILFLVGVSTVTALYRFYPRAAILIGLLPQLIYTTLSVGWYVHVYPALSPIAVFAHVAIAGFFILFLWMINREAMPHDVAK